MQFPRGSALVMPHDHACVTHAKDSGTGPFHSSPTTRYVCAFKVWLSDSMKIQSMCATPQRRHVTVPRSTLLHPLSLRELRTWERAKVLRVARVIYNIHKHLSQRPMFSQRSEFILHAESSLSNPCVQSNVMLHLNRGDEHEACVALADTTALYICI